MKTLSIIIPVYNEEKTLQKVLDYVRKVDIGPYKKEVIVVDDGSKDKSREILKKEKEFKIIFHKKNKGKGGAVKTGIEKAAGDYIVFHDADLEYDPADFKYMLPLMETDLVDIVIGSRFKGRPQYCFGKKKNVILLSYLGNMLLKWVWNILYKDNLSDTCPCYKLMRLKDLKSIKVNADGFVFDLEMMIKLRKKGKVFVEVPIHFKHRTFEEGKKIGAKDGWISLWYLIWFRFVKW
ncbi:glycosyl transferase [Candidatus Woesearchaeota archaeon CG10_big_fil_rev_8_21_14_0_10_37_12]|nr:MAG: glycosyl transferase [Candidatus Woesearchaeota archaeon CG10_big_fil_rev_8_21_14_0_10_37_12]